MCFVQNYCASIPKYFLHKIEYIMLFELLSNMEDIINESNVNNIINKRIKICFCDEEIIKYETYLTENILSNCGLIRDIYDIHDGGDIQIDITGIAISDIINDIDYILEFQGTNIVFTNFTNTQLLDLLMFTKYTVVDVIDNSIARVFVIVPKCDESHGELFIPYNTNTLVIECNSGITSIHGFAKIMIMNNSSIIGNIVIDHNFVDSIQVDGSKLITSFTGWCKRMSFNRTGLVGTIIIDNNIDNFSAFSCIGINEVVGFRNNIILDGHVVDVRTGLPICYEEYIKQLEEDRQIPIPPDGDPLPGPYTGGLDMTVKRNIEIVNDLDSSFSDID